MVFTMLCWKNKPHPPKLPLWRNWLRALGCCAIWAILVLLSASLAQAQEAPLRVFTDKENVSISADIPLKLTDTVQQSIEKGISIVFVAKAIVMRNRWYWSDKKISEAQRSYRLSYVPLTQKWKVQLTTGKASGPTGLNYTNNFDSLEKALEFMRRIANWRIANTAQMEDAVEYRVEFSYTMDSNTLPRPLQIGLIGEGDWGFGIERQQKFYLSEQR